MSARSKEGLSAAPAELLTRQTTALGRELRRLRLNKGLSIQAFAAMADVSAGLLSQIERGISSPSLRTLTKLRHALDVPLGALFDEGKRPAVAKAASFSGARGVASWIWGRIAWSRRCSLRTPLAPCR